MQTFRMKTTIIDISGLTEETQRRAQVFREPEAIAIMEDAMEKIRQAAEVLRGGGLVAFPTETVYGIGAAAFDEEAVRRVYEAKGRPQDNPMIVHIARASDISLLAKSLTPSVVKLADAFWPGPLTMVLEKKEEVPDCTTGGLNTVGVRLPDSLAALELIRAAGVPIAAPSANLSGSPSPTKAAHVIADLDGKVDVILAGPECRVGIESTVIDMTTDPPLILRPGVVTRDDIETVLEAPVGYSPLLNNDAAPPPRSPGMKPPGALASASPLSNNDAAPPPHSPGMKPPDAPAGASPLSNNDAPPPRSPGMRYRHYAPKARMLVVEGARDRVRSEVYRLKTANENLGLAVGVLYFEEKSFLEAAHDFYADLRELDDSGVDLIIAGALPATDGVGFAVMNRMMKAAGYNIVRV